MNVCPDCDRTLPPMATACRCGWKQQIQEPRRSQLPQIISQEIEAQNQVARDSLKAQGLERRPDESAAEFHARMMEWLKGNASFRRFGATHSGEA